MPTLRCTAKLAKRGGFKIPQREDVTINDWHANTFTFDRRFYVIFVQDRSRLTCLAGPVKKPNLQDMSSLLQRSLRTVLIHEGFNDVEMKHALIPLQNMHLAKTNNKSVLGTINDNTFHIDFHLWRAGGIQFTNLAVLAAHVNYMPMGPLKGAYPIEIYKQGIIHEAIH